ASHLRRARSPERYERCLLCLFIRVVGRLDNRDSVSDCLMRASLRNCVATDRAATFSITRYWSITDLPSVVSLLPPPCAPPVETETTGAPITDSRSRTSSQARR